jgi:hypothetical protein
LLSSISRPGKAWQVRRRPKINQGAVAESATLSSNELEQRRGKMIKAALVCLALIALGCHFSQAQDIAGIEDCTKTAGLDKRTSCLQSNVNFLQRLVTKNALEAEQRLNAATNEIVALKNMVTSLQTVVQELKAAQKPPSDKKTDRMP